MQILVKDNVVKEYAPNIELIIDDTIAAVELWKLTNEEGVLKYYRVNDGCTLFKNVTLPSDFVRGKYFFIDGEFVLNEDWEPFKSPEERIIFLEAENERLTNENLESMEIEAELLYEVAALQLGL